MNIIAELFADMQRESNATERRLAQANPVKYRLSRVMDGNNNYSYFEARNGRGSRVRFCYSTNRNVAGNYLIWREVITARQLKRDQWDCSRSKDGAVRAARTMYDRFKARK